MKRTTSQNSKSVTAIPVLLFTNVTAAQGNKSMMAAEPVNHPKNFVFNLLPPLLFANRKYIIPVAFLETHRQTASPTISLM